MVLGKFPVPRRPTIWMIVDQGPVSLQLVRMGVFGHFYSPLSFLSSFSLFFGRRSDIALNTVSKGR